MSDASAFATRRRGRRTVRRVRSAAAVLVAAVVALTATGALAQGSSSQWNIERVGAPAASGGDVVVAVVDTGVDATHPAFGDRVLDQLDFTGDGQRGDPQGHGTHVAGIVAGGTIDCGQGPSAIGVAPDVQILPVRVLDAEGSGNVSDVVAGIRAAADRGVEVINLSLGGDLTFLDGGSEQFRAAVNYAWSKGAIPVLAAGNSGLLGSVFGSGYGGLDAVVVTATTDDDRKAGYASSVGSAKWGISAPGGDGSGDLGRDILSSYPDGRCAVLSGTSMAAPHVSGALAVLRSHGLGPGEAVERLRDTATPIGSSSTYGAGLLALRAALSDLELDEDVEVSDAGTTRSPSTTDVASPSTTAPASTTTRSPGTTTEPTPEAVGESTVPPQPTTAAPSTPEPETSPVTGEVAGAVGEPVDGSDQPAPALVAVALAACAATAGGTWRLRRLEGQP